MIPHRPLKSARSLRLSLRFVLPLAVALALVAYAVVPLVDHFTLQWFTNDTSIRSRLITTTIQEPLIQLLDAGDPNKIKTLLARTSQDERLLAIGICDGTGKIRFKTNNFPKAVRCAPGEMNGKPFLLHLPRGLVHVSINPIRDTPGPLDYLVLVHDMSFVERRSEDTRNYIILFFAVVGIVISLITVLVAHLSWRGWVNGVRAMLRGEGLFKPFAQPANSELQPLVGDLRALLHAIDQERRFLDDTTITWNPEMLRTLLHKELTGDQVLVVSNREPYIHENIDGNVVVRRPASGLVTAVEPVVRACSGSWIAHGAGSSDRAVVDRHDRVGVPPENPSFTLRRIWLSEEEERGYYYGFANEGLWPLCHIAHVRPIFRSGDWSHYVTVNKRFADAVASEASSEDPVVLVQDYHFALLPRLIREALPKATIITFWHIPWPNPESFGICPWREELLQGLLGSTILGFHTPYHRKNFMETVDRYLETRIEHESSTISHEGKLTLVESYPISIQWPTPFDETQAPVPACRKSVLDSNGLSDNVLIGLGIDRLDYTKGILERLRAVERLLELHPEMSGRFTFVQIAAPSRTVLDEYKAFDVRIRGLVAEINERFSHDGYRPVILKVAHHKPDEVNLYYRAADVCVVTSLHDGMNLVAKEYIAARDDEQGVLVLSQFTGAAHELHEALIVNPYHIEQTAEAIYRALTMPEFEQRERMQSMRALVRDFNVYRWAGRMLLDAARLRRREKLARRIGRDFRK